MNAAGKQRNRHLITGYSKFVSNAKCLTAMVLSALAVAVGAQGAKRNIELRYVAPPSTKSVSVAGSFNQWNRQATPLIRHSDGHSWSVRLALEPGVYQYKFFLDDKTWVNDPATPKQDDGNGNINNLLVVAPADYATLPGRVGDDRITPSGLAHELTQAYVSRQDKTHLVLTARTRHHDVRQCVLELHKPRSQRVTMHKTYSDPLYDFWQATVEVQPHQKLQYLVALDDGPAKSFILGVLGLRSGTAGEPDLFTLAVDDFPPFEAPDWARDAVFYQIFPDRFADGDSTNDGPDVQPFGSKPDFAHRQGGDLAGVIQHLDYLKELGVNALYFNPIFEARSNHGYDTTDYSRVDPHFGNNQQLAILTEKTHAMGWHVILDGVFNHTGVDFAAFKSLIEEGERSRYRDWYFVSGFPIEVKDGQTHYIGWFGSPWLPKLNVVNPETKRYLLGIATRWIEEAHIDGWRLDAADEVDHRYWQDFRRTVRQTDPNAYLVGEIWGNAHDWLQGDQFDSVMNYRWRGATLDFFAQDRSTPSRFDAALAKIRADYPPAATDVMFNILDSHDTERLRNSCKGRWERERQAVLFQMTYPGTPCLYYGDEIGMEGGKDPDDRRAMPWDRSKWNLTTLAFYRHALAARKAHTALRRGAYRTVLADDKAGLFGFVRTYGNTHGLALFNRSDRPQQARIPLKTIGSNSHIWTDWLAGRGKGVGASVRGVTLAVTLPARGAMLLGDVP